MEEPEEKAEEPEEKPEEKPEEEPREKGEIMRHAMRLVNSKGKSAVDHANMMAKRMQETGDEDDQDFWNKIAQQVELLVFEIPPDE